jgi:hypothetical protein
MRYRSIVFIDHEETDSDDGIVQDEALRLLHHKTDDSVLWEMPTEESVNAALDYLLQWDYGESDEVTDYEPWGGADEIIPLTRGDSKYVISYNVGLSYIALTELLEGE